MLGRAGASLRGASDVRYRSEIDGLRALAVLPVILFHGGFAGFGGGYIGVDVFFVISGYLITGILLQEQTTGQLSLSRFYARRARRILPALLLVLTACVPAAWFLMTPAALDEFAKSLLAVLAFASNLWFFATSGYFDTANELKPLLHTWSLAVEEQYYLLFPLFLMLARHWRRHLKIAVLAVLSVASLALADWTCTREPAFAFYWLPTRLWELLLGALLAFWARERPEPGGARGVQRWGAELAALLGLVAIGVSVVAFTDDTPFPGLHALLPTVGTALLLAFGTADTLAGRLLSTRVLVRVGLISYSAYLWHQPLFAFARIYNRGEPPQWVLGVLSLVTLGMAYLSWRFVEVPFRHPKTVRGGRAVVAAAAVAGALSTFGVGAVASDGFASLHAERLDLDEQRVSDLLRPSAGGDLNKEMFDDGDCRFWSKRVTPDFEQRFERCAEEHGPALVLLGDSHAMNLFNAAAKADVTEFVVGVSQGGCRPHRNGPKCHYDGFDAFAARHAAEIAQIVFHQSGSYLFRDSRNRPDSPAAFRPGEQVTIAHEDIERVAAYLARLAATHEVTWLGPFVEARVELGEPGPFVASGFRMNPESAPLFERLEVELQRSAAAPGQPFRYVPFRDVLPMPDDFLLVDDCVTFRDVDHFSPCGEDLLAKALRRALQRGPLAAPERKPR